MNHDDHRRQAQVFLAASDREFDDGERMQACEKLWGAVTQAVIAAAMQRDWPCRSHRALHRAVSRIAGDTGDDRFVLGFSVAEKFHMDYYHDELADISLETDRANVRAFVERMLALTEPAGV